jgi:hypothetical protein
MSETSAAGRTSNQQHNSIPSKPDTGITDDDVEYWVGYNNGYMDGYSDAEKQFMNNACFVGMTTLVPMSVMIARKKSP